MTDTPEMVERVARAIAGVVFDETHEGDAEAEWLRVAHVARAAIEAMEVPTPEMKAAGATRIPSPAAHDFAHDAYVTMIRASLKGESK